MTDLKRKSLLDSFENSVVKDIMAFTIPAYKKLVVISYNNIEVEDEDEDYEHITSLTGVSFIAKREYIACISHVKSISVALLSNQIEDIIKFYNISIWLGSFHRS